MIHLAECLISMVLIISPAVPGLDRYLPTTWLFERPLHAGICNSMIEPNKISILINDHDQLILTYNHMQYLIPLPPNAMTSRSDPRLSNAFRFYYILGEQFARIGDRYTVAVRMGPKDGI